MEDGIEMKKESMEEFAVYLRERENAKATIRKYLTDIRTFYNFMGENRRITKEQLLSYKEWLVEHYAISSVNSMLAALNQFLEFLGGERLKLKRIRVQGTLLTGEAREMEKTDYKRLVETAMEEGRVQLALMMETMCATGIRVSELEYFTVESLRSGMVKVWNKGKYRMVPMPEMLKKNLQRYVEREGIQTGVIFRTRNGNPKNRSNIWKEMKSLAGRAGVDPDKIFPHNL
ncbi:tyrosine-type recombinase/integrase [[Clostridium] scindens]|nr:tyrosine-type recombinase/integrase [[Clostridium] scindens]BDF17443.1 tyrosine recombinase XerD [[Clostridium] scindens]BDF21141.1 tyrosine recombinase XerD [[Clostridium] scindens]